MQKVMGLAEVNYEGEIPAEYVLTQDILVDWFPTGETTVNVYTNADHSKVLYTFFGWGENIMVEGLLINDRVADVTYDSVGYFEPVDGRLLCRRPNANAAPARVEKICIERIMFIHACKERSKNL